MDEVAVILAAAGSGSRLGGDEPKAFVEVDGRTLLELALDGVRGAGLGRVVVVAPAAGLGRARAVAVDATVVAGGPTRQRSIAAGLEALTAQPPAIVVCHDAARPFASARLFERVIAALDRWDGAIAATPVTDTIKRVIDGTVVATESREDLVAAQTPQAFRWNALADAHARAAADGIDVTDDAACLERAGHRVGVVEGETGNFKITTDEDLRRAESILAMRRG
jgi:2-C-methyl-D-erythritol 4-phosphate cytidylyltransferase / 2-C-methyl-D-erythritol 2,4-cyclodiphosphate synthase